MCGSHSASANMASGHMAEPLCPYLMGSWLGEVVTDTSSQSCLGFLAAAIGAGLAWSNVAQTGVEVSVCLPGSCRLAWAWLVVTGSSLHWLNAALAQPHVGDSSIVRHG